jgi:hypothetical protein
MRRLLCHLLPSHTHLAKRIRILHAHACQYSRPGHQKGHMRHKQATPSLHLCMSVLVLVLVVDSSSRDFKVETVERLSS